MKKFFVIALAAMSLSLVSCKKGVEDQAKAYMEDMIEAINAGDMEKADKISEEVVKWQEGLSDADKKKLDEYGKTDEAKELKKKVDDAVMKAAMKALK